MADILYSWKYLEKDLANGLIGYLHGDKTKLNEYKKRSPDRIWIVRLAEGKIWLLGYLTVTDRRPKEFPTSHKLNYIFYDPSASRFFENPTSVQLKTNELMERVCAGMRHGTMQGELAADIVENFDGNNLRKLVSDELSIPLSEMSDRLKAGIRMSTPYRTSKKTYSLSPKGTKEVPSNLPTQSTQKQPVEAEATAAKLVDSAPNAANNDSFKDEDSVDITVKALNDLYDEISINCPISWGADVNAVVKRRVGQGLFRDLLQKKYGTECFLSDLSNARLLIASHIVPWSAASPQQKTDPENGLLLSVVWDSLFDKGFISFDDDGTMRFQDYLDDDTVKCLGISRDVSLSGKYLTKARRENLAWHRAEHGFLP